VLYQPTWWYSQPPNKPNLMVLLALILARYPSACLEFHTLHSLPGPAVQRDVPEQLRPTWWYSRPAPRESCLAFDNSLPLGPGGATMAQVLRKRIEIHLVVQSASAQRIMPSLARFTTTTRPTRCHMAQKVPPWPSCCDSNGKPTWWYSRPEPRDANRSGSALRSTTMSGLNT
jgi:hypothetical protein